MNEQDRGPTVLVATWTDGVFVVGDGAPRQELAGRPVRGLARSADGTALAIVGADRVCRRSAEGAWSTVAALAAPLACIAELDGRLFLGTDDARVLRLADGGVAEPLPGFDDTPGRDSWYAGTAVVGGRVVGPPLGVRSMSVTAGGGALLANVHVGGIPRSSDGGSRWLPTIDVDEDVHEVLAHPTRPAIVAAAAATGLCLSRDGGATWALERDGLHAPYCSAVAFLGDEVLVAASSGHFAAFGTIYRRPLDGRGPLTPAGAGLPDRTAGIVDTGCLDAAASALAMVDRAGNLYVALAGRLARHVDGLPPPSGVLLVRDPKHEPSTP